MSQKVIIVGGHGKVGLRLAHILGKDHQVSSIIRNEAQSSDITAASAKPVILSLSDATLSEFSNAFEGQDVVYFTAGAGGEASEELIKKIDYEGAVKVFDAIEAVKGQKPRLILLSAIDARDKDAKAPSHYNDEDLAVSERNWAAIGGYMKLKYEADKNLVQRTTFKWTILRPNWFTDDSGTGKGKIGKMHLGQSITRQDVAQTLALLVNRPEASGLALDLVGGDTPLESALDSAIEKRESSWVD